MREKLIDLISGGVPRHEPFLSKVFEGLADHLIANGVRLEEKQATSDESKRMLNFRQENKRFGWSGEGVEYPEWVAECEIL